MFLRDYLAFSLIVDNFSFYTEKNVCIYIWIWYAYVYDCLVVCGHVYEAKFDINCLLQDSLLY